MEENHTENKCEAVKQAIRPNIGEKAIDSSIATILESIAITVQLVRSIDMLSSEPVMLLLRS